MLQVLYEIINVARILYQVILCRSIKCLHLRVFGKADCAQAGKVAIRPSSVCLVKVIVFQQYLHFATILQQYLHFNPLRLNYCMPPPKQRWFGTPASTIICLALLLRSHNSLV